MRRCAAFLVFTLKGVQAAGFSQAIWQPGNGHSGMKAPNAVVVPNEIPPGQCQPDLSQDAAFTGKIIDIHNDSLLLNEGIDYMGLRCCTVAETIAPFMRSKNRTDPLNFSIREVGPSHGGKKHDFECAIYDDGALPISASGFWAGHTRDGLDPKPPAPAPPPACSSFVIEEDCENTRRCFWAAGSCSEAPPIDCGSNYKVNLPMCHHITVKPDPTGRHKMWRLFNFAPDNGTHVVVAPPENFTSDVWFSMESREFSDHLEPWKECVSYQSFKEDDPDDFEEIQACVGLTSASFFGNVALTDGLSNPDSWWINEPYVFTQRIEFVNNSGILV